MTPADSRGTGTASRVPPQATMGLLNYVTAHSLDEDYAHVSDRRRAAGEKPEPKPGVAALLILGLFGMLVATAALQTSRDAEISAGGRAELVTQVQARSAQLDARRARIGDLRRENATLQERLRRVTERGRQVSNRLSRLSVTTGAAAVTGPGVEVVVDDAPNATGPEQRVLDEDLQKLVNALWLAGAEAVSVNGQRLTSLSAIRHAGSVITVNYRSVSPPYVVSAVGNPNSMPARFLETRHGSAWLDLEALYGLEFSMTSEESLTLPAANRLDLRHAAVPDRAKSSGDTP